MAEDKEFLPLQPIQVEISSLSKDGFFNLDGTRTEGPYSDEVVRKLEGFSEEFWQGKNLGEGQKVTLKSVGKGQEVLFGRNHSVVQVALGNDIIKVPERGDTYDWDTDQGVSRTHFGITKTEDGWEVTDKGSTSGTIVKKHDGRDVDLTRQEKPETLEEGDVILVKGDPAKGRIHILKFHEAQDGQPAYLVKAVATSLDQLALYTGHYGRKPEDIGKLSDEDFVATTEREYDSILNRLYDLEKSVLENLKSQNYPKYNRAALDFLLYLLVWAKEATENEGVGGYMWTQKLNSLNIMVSRRETRAISEGREEEANVYRGISNKIHEIEWKNDPEVLLGKYNTKKDPQD